MKIFVLTLFPEQCRGYFVKGIFKRALEKGLYDLQFIDLRDFSEDKHHKVDDYPFGEKLGMIIKADVIYRAVQSIDHSERFRLLYMCPKGPVFDHKMAKTLTQEEGIVLLLGYYKGIDERIFDLLPFERVSLGNYILSSGELPAMTILEATLRQLPGVVGNSDCVQEDSIMSGLIQAPNYTLPRSLNGVEVPEVLLSGHHAQIEAWRYQTSIKETLEKKPSLLIGRDPTDRDLAAVASYLKEEKL